VVQKTVSSIQCHCSDTDRTKAHRDTFNAPIDFIEDFHGEEFPKTTADGMIFLASVFKQLHIPNIIIP
jgi:hypothetical protein